MTTPATTPSTPPATPVEPVGRPIVPVGDAVPGVIGQPRRWLRLEGIAALVFGAALFVNTGGPALWLLPLLLVPDVSMAGYLRGPRPGAFLYNLVHNWGLGLLVLGAGLLLAAPGAVLAGSVLVAHVGMDRVAGYGLKYPTSFGDTHLGRIGKGRS